MTYVYKQASKTWERRVEPNKTDPKDTLDDATMHSYLQSAYYSIEPENDKGESIDTLELDAAVFQGLGNKGYPFRGVIVGNLRGSSQVATQAAIKIRNSKDTGALSGLIPYSYGSVVSNLNIEYSGKAASIAHKNKDASGVPGAFFGGVIGCVRSGTDGLYENVTDGISNYVTGASELAEVKAEGNAITFTDTKENGKFKTQNAGTTFSLPFTVTVKMQVEPSRFYANYRLVMTASLVKGDMASATPQSPDYVTYTLTRVNLNGIDH